jgi:hypothetical protein
VADGGGAEAEQQLRLLDVAAAGLQAQRRLGRLRGAGGRGLPAAMPRKAAVIFSLATAVSKSPTTTSVTLRAT